MWLLDALVAELDDAVQVLQRLLLRVLSLAQLLDQVLFNALQLLHLGLHIVNRLLTALLLLRVQLRRLLLLLSLGQCLVLDELPLVLLDLQSPVSFHLDIVLLVVQSFLVAFFFALDDVLLRFLNTRDGTKIVSVNTYIQDCLQSWSR